MTDSSAVQEAQLILQFYELRREPRLREAREFLLTRFHAGSVEQLNTQCPPGSDENAYFRQTLSYWDLVCAIAKRTIVERELFFETNGELTVTWERVKHLVPDLRMTYKNPLFLANLEAMAKEREVYLEQKVPGYLEALRERLRQR